MNFFFYISKLFICVQLLTPLMALLSPSLTELVLANVPSLVELPSSFQNLNGLEVLRITHCINLETLPTDINLESLYLLDLSGCSQLKIFPNISTTIQDLNLSKTGIEEVPWWIENFSKLAKLTMCGCNKLQFVSVVKLKLLYTADFSDCMALSHARWDDSSSAMAMAGSIRLFSENFPTIPDEIRLFLYNFPQVEFRFTNCFNLDQEALLQQRSEFFRSMVLSGEEVPSYFTHRTTEISLTNIPLLHTSMSQQFFKFRACAVVSSTEDYNGVQIHVNCQFRGRFGNSIDSFGDQAYFSTVTKDSHLLIFECRILLPKDNAPIAQVNYDHVDMQIHLSTSVFNNWNIHTFKFKGWGIRLLKECSLPQNQLGKPNTLPHVYETDDGNMFDENEHGEECGGTDVVTQSSKRMRVNIKRKNLP